MSPSLLIVRIALVSKSPSKLVINLRKHLKTLPTTNFLALKTLLEHFQRSVGNFAYSFSHLSFRVLTFRNSNQLDSAKLCDIFGRAVIVLPHGDLKSTLPQNRQILLNLLEQASELFDKPVISNMSPFSRFRRGQLLKGISLVSFGLCALSSGLMFVQIRTVCHVCT